MGTARKRVGSPGTRVVAAASGIAICLAGCTGGSSGSPSPSAPSSTDGTSGTTRSDDPGSSAPSAPSEPRVTAFDAAWSWQPPAALPPYAVGLVEDGTRAIVASSVRDGSMITPTTRSYLTALDVSSGKQVWQQTVAGFPESVRVVAGTVVVALDQQQANRKYAKSLVGVDAATGRPRWTHALYADFGELAIAAGAATVYANLTKDDKPLLAAINASTGAVTASTEAQSSEQPVVTHDAVVQDRAGAEVYGFDPTLKHQLWTVKPDPAGDTDDRVIGDVVVRIGDSAHGAVTVSGLDATSGHGLWQLRQDVDDANRSYWSTGHDLVITTYDSAAAVDVDTGKLAWQVQQYGAQNLATSATADGDALACGKIVVSIDATTGRTYGSATLPSGAFPNGCTVAPVQVGSPGSSGRVVVASGKTVAAYDTTVSDDPPTTAGDGLGNWGPVDPSKCAVDATKSVAALSSVLGGRWRLNTAAANGNCGFAGGGLQVTTRPLASSATAQHALDQHNDNGECTDFGSTTGSVQRVSVTGKNLPHGSGACYATGLSFGGSAVDDFVGGVTRQQDGQWLAIDYLVPHNSAVSTKQPAKIVALLQQISS